MKKFLKFFKRNYRVWFTNQTQTKQKEIIDTKVLSKTKYSNWEINDESQTIKLFNTAGDEIQEFTLEELYNTYKKVRSSKRIKNTVFVIIAIMTITIALYYGIGLIVHQDTITPDKNVESIEILETRFLLYTEVQNFIYSIAPESCLKGNNLVEECIRFDINILLPLSQGVCESHFGTKGLAKKTNSVWNVGAFDDYLYKEINSHYKFDNPTASIEAYLKLLKNRYLNGKTEEELLENFVDINGKRYASAENYERVLQKQWEEIQQTTKIDSLYKRYKLILMK